MCHLFRNSLRFIAFSISIFAAISSSSQITEQIPLYRDSSLSKAQLHMYFVDSDEVLPTVLIMPGGGYQMLAMEHEGTQVAEWFRQKGVNAIILEYSLGQFDGSGYKHPQMINEAKRAMRLIRHNAEEWNVDSNKIAVMGFSAGGHLASTLATHADSGISDAVDLVKNQSCLPNLCILFYPVIMMEGAGTHWGSRRFLLGPTPNKSDVKDLSSDQQVDVTTPPTILFHTSDDASVPVGNSINYYLALRKLGVPAEMHISEHGSHGKGLLVDDYSLGQWESLLENWLTRWKWIK